MVDFKPDPEWFKKGPYASEWKSHAEKVKRLQDKLIAQFPVLKGSIKSGLGALTDEWLKIPPDQKDEPDLTIYYKYQVLCHIEVSGTDSPRVRVPPHDIWIRPGKIDLGMQKEAVGEKYWYYMVYTNNTVVLTAGGAAPYRKKVTQRTLYGKTERYIDLPHTIGRPEAELFHWIDNELKSR
jgi:hypothetical protein